VEIDVPELPETAVTMYVEPPPVDPRGEIIDAAGDGAVLSDMFFDGRDDEEPEHGLRSTVALGGAAVQITEQYAAEDRDLLAFIRAEADSRSFHCLHLSCAFQPAGDERFESAELRFVGTDDVHVWSMEPERASHPTQGRTTLRLDAKAVLLGVGVEHERASAREAPFITAFGLHETEGHWAITRVRGVELFGSHRFHAVFATSSKEVLSRVDAGVGVVISRRRGLRREQLALGSGPRVKLTLHRHGPGWKPANRSHEAL
jgi:hypothetical protein